MSRSRRVVAAFAAAITATISVALTAVPAQASSPGLNDGGVIASVVPSKTSPNIANGSTQAIVQVGSRMIIGGTFTSVTPTAGAGAGTAVTRNYIFAFNASTGALDTGFVPAVNGEVDTIVGSSDGTSVYVAGAFTTAGGRATRMAQFNLTTGALVAAFNPSLNGPINDMELVNGHLLVAGTFTTASGAPHAGLVSLDPTTGAADTYINVQLTGHHNYGRVNGAANARVGGQAIAVNPSGTRAIVDGNFITAQDSTGTYSRDQILSLNLGGSSTAIDPNWNTSAYTYACYSGSYDSYVRDMSWSPDGSYFVVMTTGGYYNSTFQPCDAASRFDASSTGTNVQPAWVNFTGTDSLYSVAVTTSAVYIGGHQRWLNNPYGQDSPARGAVPRPGLAALDPANGVPLSWNPGRNTRGHGAEVVYATSTGVWVGSDTDYIGNYDYTRKKLAFFPFAGGTAPAGNNAGDAHSVYLAGGTAGTNSFTANTFDPATGVGGVAATQPSNGGIDWSTVRGAFVLNGRIWYGTSSGQFYYRTWDGASAYGPALLVDPYNDPYWSNVTTGSGQTYRGSATSFYAELPNVTGMFYANRSIYYTLSGSAKLYKRAFAPDTAASSVATQVTGGIISPVEVTVSDPGAGGPVNFSDASGMFLANGSLWYATKSDGKLHRAPWDGSTVSGASSIDASATGNWAARAVFVSPTASTPPPAAPTANFTSSCSATSCTFNASSSTAPGSSITSYAWSFGDTATGGGVTTSHTYAGSGTNTVTLTVTNAAGGTNAISKPVTVTAAPAPISFLGAASATGNATTETVSVPANVAAGSGLLLIATGANGSALTAPAGWTQVDTATSTAITSTLWKKVATSADAGSSVTVSFPAPAYKGTVQLLAYSGTDAADPVAAYAKKVTSGSSATSYATPTTTVPASGDYVVSVWSTKSSTVNTWTAPAGQTVRSTANGTAAGRVNSLASDGGPASAGPAGGITATTDAASSSFTAWTIVLNGAISTPPATPTANFTSSCNATACTFDGSSSTAPGSSISSYAWNFGDGATATGAATSHTFAPGTSTVTLTVTNAVGATNSKSQPVTVTAAPQPIAFVAAVSTTGNATTETVTVPAAVTAGNALLLIATGANGSAMTAPAGWTQVDTSTAAAITSTLWKKVATATDAGSTVTVSFPSIYKGAVQLLAYSGTNAGNPVIAYAKKLTSAAASSYATPTTTVPATGDYVVSVWATKSSTVNTWTAPSGQTVRSTAYGTSTGRINALASDGGAATAGPAGGLTATTDVAGAAFAAWTIILG
jgi:PKD repeat protein